MLKPEIKQIKDQLEEQTDEIREKINYFKNIEFDEYQEYSDMIAYKKMLEWLKRTNEELEKIAYADDFSMLQKS